MLREETLVRGVWGRLSASVVARKQRLQAALLTLSVTPQTLPDRRIWSAS